MRSRATRPMLMEARTVEIQASSRRGGVQVAGSNAGVGGSGGPLPPTPAALSSGARISGRRNTFAGVRIADARAALDFAGAVGSIFQARDAGINVAELVGG